MTALWDKRHFEVPDDDDGIERIRAEFNVAMDVDKLTLEGVAKLIGVPAGTLGPWRKRQYQGNNQRIAESVVRWLNLRREKIARAREIITTPGFVPTKGAKRIMALLDFAQMDGDLAVIGCKPGYGKTTACYQFAQERPNVFISTMSPSCKGVNTALQAIAEDVGDKEAKGSPQALSKRIRAKLSGTNALLIVDEAQFLTPLAVDELRSIHDATKVGLVFVGTERLFEIFDGRRTPEYAQLSSRIGMREKQGAPFKMDVETVVRSWGVEDPDMIKLAQVVALQPGGLRGITKLMKLATRLARIEEADVTLHHMKEAWSQLASMPL